jgi:hypothetical protein
MRLLTNNFRHAIAADAETAAPCPLFTAKAAWRCVAWSSIPWRRRAPSSGTTVRVTAAAPGRALLPAVASSASDRAVPAEGGTWQAHRGHCRLLDRRSDRSRGVSSSTQSVR